MALATDLPKSRRAGVLRSVGKRTRGSEANEGDLPDSIRDFGSMPSSKTTMEGSWAPNAFGATNNLQGRRGTSPAAPSFASDGSFEAPQIGGRSAPALFY